MRALAARSIETQIAKPDACHRELSASLQRLQLQQQLFSAEVTAVTAAVTDVTAEEAVIAETATAALTEATAVAAVTSATASSGVNCCNSCSGGDCWNRCNFGDNHSGSNCLLQLQRR